jgi:predicted transcriptional regulator
MNQLTLFDYNQLDAETRIITRQRAGEIKTLMRATAENIMQVGEKLLEVQVKLGNGQFDAWLSAEFDWSRRTAYNFIGVFKQFRDRANFAQIDVATSALYLLAAPSTPESAVEEVLARAEAGERITHTEAKAVVAEHKAEESARRPKLTELDFSGADKADLRDDLALATEEADELPRIIRLENPPPAPWEEGDNASATDGDKPDGIDTFQHLTPLPAPDPALPSPAPAVSAPLPPPAPAVPLPAPVISAAPLLISLTVRESGALISAQRGGQPLAMENCALEGIGQRVQALVERIYGGPVIEAATDAQWL